MATRIEFSKHGGPEVLNAVEFTPSAPGENEVQVETKLSVSTISTPIFAAGCIRHRQCPVV